MNQDNENLRPVHQGRVVPTHAKTKQALWSETSLALSPEIGRRVGKQGVRTRDQNLSQVASNTPPPELAGDPGAVCTFGSHRQRDSLLVASLYGGRCLSWLHGWQAKLGLPSLATLYFIPYVQLSHTLTKTLSPLRSEWSPRKLCYPWVHSDLSCGIQPD